MAIVTTNLENCIVRNHTSFEIAGDNVNANTLPSHVVIEIRPDQTASNPVALPTGAQGYWGVSAIDFNISGATGGTLTSSTEYGQGDFVPNSDIIINIGVAYNPGKLFKYGDMIGTANGQANWDQLRVQDVMICDRYVGGSNPHPKNYILVYVRLVNIWIMPPFDNTINIDINGGARWVQTMGGPGSIGPGGVIAGPGGGPIGAG